MMRLLAGVYSFIKSRGIGNQSKSARKLIELLNIISCLTVTCAFIIFIAAKFIFHDEVYALLSWTIGTVVLLIPIFHHYGLIKWREYYCAAVIPIWYTGAILLIGGYFSQSLIVLANIFMCFLFFKERPTVRKFFLWYNVIIYILASFYVGFYGPISEASNYFFDEILVFIICFLWMTILFSVYKSENEEHVEALQAQNDKLQSKTIELERFSYMAAHDLRSPLIYISGFMNIIKKDLADKKYENIGAYAEIAYSGANRMSALLGGIQKISDLNRRPKNIPKLVDLNAPLQKAIGNIQSDINAKKAEVRSNDLPEVYCVESDFVIIFQNLIQNGIKYNDKAQPIIEISHSREANYFYINVRDNGIGIPEKHRDQIFEFFKRLHSREKYAGTGLGLGICKKLIDEMNGKIEVSSNEGLFTEFSLRFPLEMMSSHTQN